MSNVTKIHGNKTPHRTHFIPEWASHRNMKQADIVRELDGDVDKSLVSRWFKGVKPGDAYLERLAGLFGTDVNGLFRHPDDDWIAKFFRDKTEEQKERAISMLKLLFDPTRERDGTEG